MSDLYQTGFAPLSKGISVSAQTMQAPNLVFYNIQREKIGTLNFSGSAMTFEGNAEMSALEFIDWAAGMWSQRLKEEYERGVKDGKAQA